MNHQIKPGDRVRLTVRNCQPAYQAGDKGTVLAGPNPSANGETYYVVQMGDDPAARPLVFTSDEIEREE
jgi:hypothetical protein